MKFLDEAKIFIAAGHGGPGASSFRREKYIEFGGPDGGKGGKGGDVIFLPTEDLNTLIDFRYRQHFKAKRGRNGAGANRSGQNGDDLIVSIPVGTQIFLDDKQTMLYDFTEAGKAQIVAKGGDGGRGNQSFKSSVNQSPRRSEPGWPGEEMWLWLRLKLLANVGLIGLPNAGKSTLLSVLTRARPKIGDYPFTTLHPQLGVVSFDDRERVIADIPGLIEGAHEGKGLGTRFLGHIERCQLLIHLIDATSDDLVNDYNVIINELQGYGAGLMDKQQIVVLNKCDALPLHSVHEKQTHLANHVGGQVLTISAVSGDNLSMLKATIFAHEAI